MRSSTYLYACLLVNSCIHGLPTGREHGWFLDEKWCGLTVLTRGPAMTARSEMADGDDQVVYSWSLPDENIRPDNGLHQRSETADGDDRVVYSWSLPEEKRTAEDGPYKRSETADGDDRVVYSWSLPEEKATS